MRAYTLTDVDDHVLVNQLKSLLAQDRGITALVLAHLAEVEARHIHLQAGYPSMHAYCVHELGLSDDAANKRIHATPRHATPRHATPRGRRGSIRRSSTLWPMVDCI